MLVYDADRRDGRLNLTASAFNQLGQHTSSPGRRTMQNSPFTSQAVVVTIASTHCAYPRRPGWVGLGGWLPNETVYRPEGRHPSHY